MYIKAKCQGITNPIFYFKFDKLSIEEAKIAINEWLDSFTHISLSCPEKNKEVLLDDNVSSENKIKAINLEE